MALSLQKAIETLRLIVYRGEDRYDDNDINAVKLGIEALKAWKMFREGRWMSGRYDLLGETKK